MENNNQDIKLCPSCGARNKAVYNYCNECGAALNQTDYANSANTAQSGYANAGHQNQYSANGSYYGGGFKCAPIADITDGLIDLLIVKKVSRIKFLSLIIKLRGEINYRAR